MSDLTYWLEQLVNGLAGGAVYALLAAGIALVFGVVRLLNFAHGSVYMAGAYLGWVLVVQLHCPLWLALPLVLVGGALLGLLVDWLVLGPFHGRPGMAGLLATLGAGMILDNLFQIIFTASPQSFPPLLPTGRLIIAGVSLGASDGLIILLALASATGIYVFLQHSRWGMAIRASAQDPDAARLMGIQVEPTRRMVVMLASALAALAGVLIGLHYNQISPAMGFDAGIKGFVACLAGGLGSIPASMAGGLLVGVLESLSVAAFGSASKDLVVFIVLLLSLALRPDGLFSRRAMPLKEALTGTFVPPGKAVALPVWSLPAFFALAAILPLFVTDPYTLQVLGTVWVYALAACGLTLLSGTGGIVSLGHAAPMAVGAYAYALLSLRLGLSFLPALGLACLVGSIFGTLLVLPALRLHGHYLGLATFIGAELVSRLILNTPGLTNGSDGISSIPPPQLGAFAVLAVRDWYWLLLCCLLVVAAALTWFFGSRTALRLRALREDESAARAVAIPASHIKVLAFALASGIGALAGALIASQYSYIDNRTFSPMVSITLLTIVITGGMGHVAGAILGALVLLILPEALRFLPETRWLVHGLALVLILRIRPQGLLGAR